MSSFRKSSRKSGSKPPRRRPQRNPQRRDSEGTGPTNGIIPDSETELAVGERFVLTPQSMTPDGECIARVDGFVVFVAGAVPEETVTAEITSLGPNFGRARVVSVAEASPFRTEPKCKHAGSCGGCIWQHIDYAEQLQWKKQFLESLLENKLRNSRLSIKEMIGAPEPWGTRNKIHYSVSAFGGGRVRDAKLCHHRSHSVDLEVIDECPVHHPAGDAVARAALSIITKRRFPIANRRSGQDGLRDLLIRTVDSNSSHVVLVATNSQLPGLAETADALLQLSNVDGVHINVQKDHKSNYLGRETRLLCGRSHLVERVGGVDFHVSPDVFFQTNAAAAELLLQTVTQAMPTQAGERVLDLYSGVGLFSLPLAKAGANVIAVEENPNSVADGQKSARRNGISNCRFITSRTQSYLKKLPKSQKFDTVILDPPREGCPDWAMTILARGVRPRRIINVSCNPQALAEDLAILTTSGYKIREIQPIDMFPHTAHIESVAILDRK